MPTFAELDRKQRLPEPFGRDTEQILVIGLNPENTHGLNYTLGSIENNKIIKQAAISQYHGKMEFLSKTIYDSLEYSVNDLRRFVIDYYTISTTGYTPTPNSTGGVTNSYTHYRFYILDRKTSTRYSCDRISDNLEKYASAYFKCLEDCSFARRMNPSSN